MPLEPPFDYHFVLGDLIYGLSHQRGGLSLYFALNDPGSPSMDEMGQVPITVDQYRTSSMEQFSKKPKANWKQFLRDNERHLKYGRYMRAIRAYNNNEEAFNDATDNEAKVNSAWRAKSKFGMEWVISNETGRIHFVLNDIDMGAVVTKTHEYRSPDSGNILAWDFPRGKSGEDDQETKIRTITHSELRWVYRHRRIPAVRERVQFWRGSGALVMGFPENWTPVGAPWNDHITQVTLPSGKQISSQAAWRLYRPQREPLAF